MNFSQIQSALTDEEHMLLKRVGELCSRASDGSPAFSGFLTPRESYIISAFGYASSCRRDELTSQEHIGFFWGGYPDAERRLFAALPSFAAYSLPESDGFEGYTGEDLAGLAKDELDLCLKPLLIRKSGYVELSHRDYMGALLGLGIDRSHIGDIVLVDEGAVVFADPKIAGFIKTSLTGAGRDRVKVTDAEGELVLSRRFEPAGGTVASARLDAIVSELANTSRETAKELIRRGLVEHNYFTAADADAVVSKGDVISVRREGRVKGGKFIIDNVGDLTGKGRIRLAARRYI